MFERCLYFNVNALARSVNRVWDAAYAEFGLSPSHAYLLRVVNAQPGLTPKQISETLKLEKSTVTRFLDALQEKGFILRKSSVSGDAREQGIYPAKKAQHIAANLEQAGNALYQHMLDSLGKSALTAMVKQMREAQVKFD